MIKIYKIMIGQSKTKFEKIKSSSRAFGLFLKVIGVFFIVLSFALTVILTGYLIKLASGIDINAMIPLEFKEFFSQKQMGITTSAFFKETAGYTFNLIAPTYTKYKTYILEAIIFILGAYLSRVFFHLRLYFTTPTNRILEYFKKIPSLTTLKEAQKSFKSLVERVSKYVYLDSPPVMYMLVDPEYHMLVFGDYKESGAIVTTTGLIKDMKKINGEGIVLRGLLELKAKEYYPRTIFVNLVLLGEQLRFILIKQKSIFSRLLKILTLVFFIPFGYAMIALGFFLTFKKQAEGLIDVTQVVFPSHVILVGRVVAGLFILWLTMVGIFLFVRLFSWIFSLIINIFRRITRFVFRRRDDALDEVYMSIKGQKEKFIDSLEAIRDQAEETKHCLFDAVIEHIELFNPDPVGFCDTRFATHRPMDLRIKRIKALK